MKPSAILQAHDLVKRYGELLATNHVSLEVYPHEIHALIGPNGAGKTTLVTQLSGQLQSDSGELFFEASKSPICPCTSVSKKDWCAPTKSPVFSNP